MMHVVCPHVHSELCMSCRSKQDHIHTQFYCVQHLCNNHDMASKSCIASATWAVQRYTCVYHLSTFHTLVSLGKIVAGIQVWTRCFSNPHMNVIVPGEYSSYLVSSSLGNLAATGAAGGIHELHVALHATAKLPCLLLGRLHDTAAGGVCGCTAVQACAK